jgi:8-oxo-dGTP diphosphatase
VTISEEQRDRASWQSLGVEAADAGQAENDQIVAALLVRDGRVLLCHRSTGRRWFPDVWDLPGGHIDPGETPIEALVRELEEEVGISIKEPGAAVARVVESKFVMRIWLIEQWVGDPINASPAEHDDLGWFSLAEAEEMPLAHRDYLALIRNALS